MHFSYVPTSISDPSAADAATFRIGRLVAERAGEATDVSHLIDCSYGYHSPRELKWHLADRFGLPVHAVVLRRH
jgi:hypothetical protein